MKTLNICYALNDRYASYCGASMVSILENNRTNNIVFHILSDTIEQSFKSRLKSYIKDYNADIIFYKVNDSKLDGQKITWSKYGWYRIFASELLPKTVDKLLYLDCDTIVVGNISDLFDIPNSDWSLAAVPDYMTIQPKLYERIGYNAEEGYFCSGVLLMNLDYFRKHNLSEKVLRFALENPERIQFPDQDALNCVCKDSKVRLPLKYGILDPFYRDERFARRFADEVKESLDDPRIVHYAGCAPWIAEYQHHYFADEFWKYAAMIGGVKKRHCCTGLSLFILKTKCLLGRLGIKNFQCLLPRPRLNTDDILRKMN